RVGQALRIRDVHGRASPGAILAGSSRVGRPGLSSQGSATSALVHGGGDRARLTAESSHARRSFVTLNPRRSIHALPVLARRLRTLLRFALLALLLAAAGAARAGCGTIVTFNPT